MADVIARFKGDTSDLDTKIKKASQTLLQMKADCDKVGGAFINLDKEQVQFIRDIGRMETGCKDARSTVATLTKSFTDLSAMYNRLSEEEKRDEGGKALRASLDELKVRIREGQTELKNISGEISNSGNALDQLSSRLGISSSQLIGWGTAIGAGKVALDTLKDAFFNNENQLDEWGRIVQSSESVYNAFLNSLNNGDISGFLANIDSIISAARDAYDSLDELGTYNAFNQRNKARNNAGYSEALERYKKNPTADNKKALEEANRKVVANLSNEAQKSEKAYQDALRKLAKERGLNKKEQDRFVEIFSNGSYGDLKNAKAGYGRSGLFGMNETWNGQRVVNGRVEVSNGTGRTVGGTTFRDMSSSEKERFKFAQALSGVNDTEINAVQALGAKAEQLNQAIADQNRSFNRMSGNNAPRTTSHTGNGRTSTTKSVETFAEGSIADLQQKLAAASKAINEAATTEARVAAQTLYDEYKKKIDFLKEEAEFKASGKTEMADLTTSASDQLEKLRGKDAHIERYDEKKLREQAERNARQQAKDKKDPYDGMKELVGGVSDLNTSLNALGIDLGEGFTQAIGIFNGIFGVIEAISTISSAVNTILAIDQPTQTFTLQAILDELTVLTATSWLPFHNGGIVHAAQGWSGVVPGAANGGRDTIPAMLSPQEVVLNAGQASNVAAQLQQGGVGGSLNLETTVRGEDLRILLNNNSRRRLKGEYLTSKGRR